MVKRASAKGGNSAPPPTKKAKASNSQLISDETVSGRLTGKDLNLPGDVTPLRHPGRFKEDENDQSDKLRKLTEDQVKAHVLLHEMAKDVEEIIERGYKKYLVPPSDFDVSGMKEEVNGAKSGDVIGDPDFVVKIGIRAISKFSKGFFVLSYFDSLTDYVDEALQTLVAKLRRMTIGEIQRSISEIFAIPTNGYENFPHYFFSVLESLQNANFAEHEPLYLPYIEVEQRLFPTDGKVNRPVQLNSLVGYLNSDYGRAPGINRAFSYMSFAGSPFPTHAEDGNMMSSMNVVLDSREDACKMWCVCPPSEMERVMRECKKLLEKCSELDRGGNVKRICSEIFETQVGDVESCLMFHKRFLISPVYFDDFEQDDKIKYKIVLQRKQELIYVCSRALHGGGNTGEVYAEAVNCVGADFTLLFRDYSEFRCPHGEHTPKDGWPAFHTDQLQDLQMTYAGAIALNEGRMLELKEQETLIETLRAELETLTTEGDTDVSDGGSVPKSRDSVKCPHCDKIISQKSNMKRHFRDKHPDKIEAMMTGREIES